MMISKYMLAGAFFCFAATFFFALIAHYRKSELARSLILSCALTGFVAEIIALISRMAGL